MDLKEFITATLIDVIEGVKDAQGRAAEMGAVVNYAGATVDGKSCVLDFDVAVKASSTESGKAGARVEVLSIGFGVEGQKASGTESVSRIRFSIRVQLPQMKGSLVYPTPATVTL